jgi:rod shape determining protein RodA
MAITVGLLPITGMTLPFVSYGGSSLVSVFILTGLIFNVAMRRPTSLNRHSFEFNGDDGS